MIGENEPNEFWSVDKKTGFLCWGKKNSLLGTWNGYVFLPKSKEDKIKELNLHEIKENKYGEYDNKYFKDLDVHGGITYWCVVNSKFYFESSYKNDDYFICIGFDCAHWEDIIPAELETYKHQIFHKPLKKLRESLTKRTYKDVNFVKKECEKLAKQLYDLLEE